MKPILLAVAALFLCHPAAAQPPTLTAAQQQIIRLEHDWLAHEYSAAVLGPLLAPDFVHVLPGGFITRAQQLHYLETHPDRFHGTRRFEQLRVRVYGAIAIATGIVLATPVAGPPRRTLFTDVFLRRHGRWQAVNAQETPAKH